MTFLTTFQIAPASFGNTLAPRELALPDLTIVVPVKNNQEGLSCLLEACQNMFSQENHPFEIIVVDNLSTPPLQIPQHLTLSLPVSILICTRPGAATARNQGIRQAQTRWILFLDSDCIPTSGIIDGYRQALNGAIAYIGAVRAEGKDPISRYYDTQVILKPLPVWEDNQERPAYLITANTLIWREALIQVEGFDESFPSAGGEDIDLGLRLRSVGPLAYAPVAQTLHTFEPSLPAFIRRFIRYGRGNRLLAIRYQTKLVPRPFIPRRLSPINWFLAGLQFICLWWGYHISNRKLLL